LEINKFWHIRIVIDAGISIVECKPFNWLTLSQLLLMSC